MPSNENARYDLELVRLARQKTIEADDGVSLVADLAGEVNLIVNALPVLPRHGQDHLDDLRQANAAFQRALHYYVTYLHLQASDFNGFLGDIAEGLSEMSESERSTEN